MSGFGGFGFGQNNNQQQNTGFGGFGANTNTNTGFGSTGNTGFGATNTTGGGLFGSGGGSSTGFGSSGGGFGTTTNNAFGAKPSGFGTATTSSGGLFGSGTATTGGTGFGGFGSTNNTATSSPFGATNTGGGLFGASKPAFGSSTTTSNPFGGGATTTAFGGTTTSAFGAPASTALGGGAGECQGTGSVPFTPFIEKEPNSTSNQQNAFQNICFQQPYQKFSPEELRLADYNQGRRYGNGSNQAGAFGQTNFGGFGTTTTNTGFGANNNTTTGTSLFGAAATSSPFGTSQPASTGFGTNTATAGGGLFGAKPATGGLFGSQPAAQPSGGLFGNTGGTGFGTTTTGAFGANNNTNTGGSLFGNNSTTANKPFAFGSTQPAASTGTGFGATTTTTGGFGGGLFGNNNQQQNTTTGFGAQPAASNPFGGFGANNQQQTGTNSLFGNTANKPAGGLFGAPAASTGTSLFGNNQPATTTTPFGGSTTTQNTGLFGQKPATTTTGLFGNTANTQTNTGTGLFGNFGNTQTQPQQQQQSSLFGGLNNNNNQQQKPSLFGNTGTQQQSGSSLFGNSGSQQQQGGLFGNLNNSQQGQQQQPQNSMFGGSNSMFGASQQGQQTQALTASINDATALGGSFFAGLGTTQVPNPGPLATPLSSGAKAKKSAALPMYKLNSASASRFSTPQKQRGFGFSYSTLNSPASASSTASTPGTFGGSLLTVGSGNSFGRLSKSMSTSSLRRSFSAEDSILAPGAFSASSSARQYGSTGSVKKLTISRNLRQDLFSPPNPPPPSTPSAPVGGILKKRVSFDANVNSSANGASSPLKQANSAAPSSEELGYMRPRASNGGKTNGTSSTPEMEQVSHANNQLAIVAEEESVTPVQSAQPKNVFNQPDQQPGEYWMTPSKEEIEKMTRAERQQVHLTVGRYNIGKVEFLVPVNLTDINLDDIMGGIVVFIHRSCTVYAATAKKPPMGKGLNVPSRIWLENSWPRGKKTGATLMAKHIHKLMEVGNTKFVEYNKDTGTWCFDVEHFTTYACPEDDDEEDEFGQSTLSAPPDTPTPKMRGTPRSIDRSFASISQVTDSDAEDTFEFRKKKILPGAFDDQEAFVEEEPEQEYSDSQNSFLDERSVGSESEDGVDEPMDQDDVFQDDESVSIQDQEMVGSYPGADNTTELVEEDSQGDIDMEVMAQTPGAIMRARMRAIKSGTPLKQRFSAGDDWANTLTATVSPKKQDRALLKSLIDLHGNDSRPDDQPTPVQRRVISTGQGFATSIDLMNSLFGQARSPVKPAKKVPATAKGFEWPYAKRPKTADHDTSNMSPQERAFRDSMKPSWGPDGTLVYAAASNIKPFGRSSRRARARDGLLNIQKGGIVSENRDVRFAKFSNEAAADLLKKHKELTIINDAGEVPFAYLERGGFSFLDFTSNINGSDPATTHEKLVWRLASVLFDPIVVPNELQSVPNVKERLRKDKLSSFWQTLVDGASHTQATLARSNEEKAIACLSGHKVADACAHLVLNRDYHLATLVALIGTKDSMRKDMREQLNEWQKSRMLSEFSEPIRAIYELLAGNVCICDGSKGPEDRMESFVISKRFGLDWRRAFGLRLWYGILSGDPIETAVEDFADDVAQDKETSQPDPWYVESKVPPLWDDQDIGSREDLLWGLLKLYTFDDVNLEEVLRPENSQLSPLDTRLSWQLSQALCNTDAVRYANDDEDRPDRLTLSFASQLTNEGSWLDATFVLLHLTRDVARAKSIQDHLAHHAGLIGAENSLAFTTLTETLKIPAAWVWEAKALYMRSVEKNPRGEVECLIKAGSFSEAHRTFAKEVAPRAIIELDYDTLRSLLHGFEGKKDSIAEWHVGGEIYQDYLYLLDFDKKGGAFDHNALQRLLASLPAVVEESRHPAFMETVAVETMSSVVAKTVVALGKKGEKDNLHKVLRLPLTEDKYLKHTVELSLEYYRAAVVSAK